jgi:hypothetical protein
MIRALAEAKAKLGKKRERGMRKGRSCFHVRFETSGSNYPSNVHFETFGGISRCHPSGVGLGLAAGWTTSVPLHYSSSHIALTRCDEGCIAAAAVGNGRRPSRLSAFAGRWMCRAEFANPAAAVVSGTGSNLPVRLRSRRFVRFSADRCSRSEACSSVYPSSFHRPHQPLLLGSHAKRPVVVASRPQRFSVPG